MGREGYGIPHGAGRDTGARLRGGKHSSGCVFNLGQTNTLSAISKLVGSVTGPSLFIDNNSAERGATALKLQVEAGKAPLTVSPGAGMTTGLRAEDAKTADIAGFA